MTAASHVTLAPPATGSAVTQRPCIERRVIIGRACDLRRLVPAGRSDAANEEWELVARLLRRDEAAWRAFRTRFDPTVRRAIARITRRASGCSDVCEIDDVHAAWLCSLLEDDMHKLRRFDPARGSLSAFLHVLATRAAISHRRSCARHRWDAPLDEEVLALATPDRDPAHVLEDSRRSRALDGALRTLSERDRRFVDLLYIEGQSAEQVARALQVTVETVYTRKVRIHRRLQKAHARALA